MAPLSACLTNPFHRHGHDVSDGPNEESLSLQSGLERKSSLLPVNTMLLIAQAALPKDHPDLVALRSSTPVSFRSRLPRDSTARPDSVDVEHIIASPGITGRIKMHKLWKRISFQKRRCSSQAGDGSNAVEIQPEEQPSIFIDYGSAHRHSPSKSTLFPAVSELDANETISRGEAKLSISTDQEDAHELDKYLILDKFRPSLAGSLIDAVVPQSQLHKGRGETTTVHDRRSVDPGPAESVASSTGIKNSQSESDKDSTKHLFELEISHILRSLSSQSAADANSLTESATAGPRRLLSIHDIAGSTEPRSLEVAQLDGTQVQEDASLSIVERVASPAASSVYSQSIEYPNLEEILSRATNTQYDETDWKAMNMLKLDGLVETESSLRGEIVWAFDEALESTSPDSLTAPNEQKHRAATSRGPEKQRKRHSFLRHLFVSSDKRRSTTKSLSQLRRKASRYSLGFLDGVHDRDDVEASPSRKIADTRRSISMVDLVSAKVALSDSDACHRKDSLAEYEQRLTATGDDRRRPSHLNLQELRTIHGENERKIAHGDTRRVRSKSLGDSAGDLMERALVAHQEEKAVFHSMSKQAHSQPGSRNEHLMPFTTDSRGRAAPRRTVSLNDRHRNAVFDHTSRPESTDRPKFLCVPGSDPPHHSPVAESRSLHIPSKKPNSARIGTNLPSWCKFPSHTRALRAESAGLEDLVRVRDFAINAGINAPKKKSNTKSNIKKVKSMSDRRSMTFGDLWRYYGNIFTTGQAGNRRSSVSTGGWLEHPDLEMLSPIHHAHRSLTPVDSSTLDTAIVGGPGDTPQHKGAYDEPASITSGARLRHQTPSPTTSIGFLEDSVFSPRSLSSSKSRQATIGLGPCDGATKNFALVQDGPTAGSRGIGTDRFAFDGATCDDQSSTSRWLLQDTIGFIKNPVHQLEPNSAPVAGHSTGPDEQVPRSSSLAELVLPRLNLLRVRGAGSNAPDSARPLADKLTVRRFPSVTVVDDMKGHSRSVSLISTRTDHSATVRASTNDLIKFLGREEKQERFRLLQTTFML